MLHMTAAVWSVTALADYRDDIGFTRLAAELGGAMPSGAGIKVVQVEASESTNGQVYMPNTNDLEFTGKSFTNASGASNDVSGHATTVGRYYYGLQAGMATGISDVAMYLADDWLSSFLRIGQPSLEPATETRQIQNHSWIAFDDSLSTDAVRRLDYAIERDGFVAIVAPNNGSGTNLPAVPGHSYNAICVGRSDGDHSAGGTRFDEAGRVKPDLVVPLGATSFTAPAAASAAALLLQTATNAGLQNAKKPECVKAILMAGATRTQFPSWNRTSARPLDSTYGAGQLNVYNSYIILTNGQQTASSSNLVSWTGWDRTGIVADGTSTYFFAVPAGTAMTDLSVVLAWSRRIVDGNPSPTVFDPQPEVLNLDLEFWSASNHAVVARLDMSTSIVDNVERIVQKNLPAGQYALRVLSNTNCSYALAWHSDVLEQPRFSSIVLSADGQATISASIASSHTYIVQAADSLILPAWSNLATNLITTNLMQFIDPASTNRSRRFYRIQLADP
ncbi:MAG: hypothetical protein C0404_09480 [Verrucomicrobia bacterium]|nr:hypothetical protein [Verrucomicrobiota bacterium]